MESVYRRLGGTPAATAPVGLDPALVDVERALLRMPIEKMALRRKWVNGTGPRQLVVIKALEAPGLTLRFLYAYRWQPCTICEELVPRLRPAAWPGHIGACRSMLAALLVKREQPGAS